jgi:predicted PurR-regulated permease PerM
MHPTELPPSSPPMAGSTPGQRAASAALALILVLLGVWTLHRFLPALAWAAILAIAVWPLYQRVRRRFPVRGHDILVPGLFAVGVALLFLVPLALAGVQLAHEGQTAFEWIRDVQHNGAAVPDWVSHLPFGSSYVTRWWEANLADPDQSAELMRRLHRGELLTFGREFGLRLVNRAVLFGFAILALFFLFRDGDRLTAQLLRASLRAFGPGGERVARQMVASVHGTVDGLVLVGLGEGVLMGISYAVAGVPHPAMLGAATAIAAMIPFAAPVVFGLAAVLLVAQGAAVAGAVVFAFGMAVTFIADHFIRPVLIGGATRLPFLWVLLGILGGVEVWGLLGLFLGPALMSLVLLWREWTEDPAAPAA